MRFVWLALAACSGSPATAPVTTPRAAATADARSDDAMDDYPGYPGARALTDGRVYANTAHISWYTTATSDAPAAVVAHYEKLLGARATSNGKTWSFTTKRDEGDTWVSRTLEIIPAPLAKDFPGREVPPAAGEQTVILSSIAMGKKE